MDSSQDSGWHVLDDDGRDFLEQALGQVEGGAAPDPAPVQATAATGKLATLLQAAVAAGASDLHLSVDLPPHVRVGGVLRPLGPSASVDAGPIEAAEMQRMIDEVLSPEQRRELATSGDLDTGMTLAGTGLLTGLTPAGTGSGGRRFRASLFRQSGTLAAAIRVVPDVIPELDQLGLPPVVSHFAGLTSGLVLVTGPTGSGKSTTLAAMIEEVNRARPAHIVTIEDPIEYRYTPIRSVIQQREIGTDTSSFSAALRRALRQDPDVLLIGELRDLETIRIALTAAETGHLVLATLHSADVASAVNRIIDVFPAEQQTQIRSQMALSVQGCISQRLLPALGGGVVPATEVMVATSAVKNLIRERKVHQLRSTLETGADVGMHTFDQSIASLIRQRRLDPTAAGLASGVDR
jgi:twitching motility protein PilT